MAVLGGIAGAVDAVAYQVLGHVYVSNMTGNTDGFGIALLEGHVAHAIERGFTLLAFLAGVFLGTALVKVARIFLVELALATGTFAAIAAFAAHGGPLGASDWQFYVVAALAAISMGVQNIALLSEQGDGPFTTHLTGALTSLAHGVARRVLGRGEPEHRTHAALFAGFLGGGVLAMFVYGWSPAAAAALPLPALAVVAARRYRAGRSVHA